MFPPASIFDRKVPRKNHPRSNRSLTTASLRLPKVLATKTPPKVACVVFFAVEDVFNRPFLTIRCLGRAHRSKLLPGLLEAACEALEDATLIRGEGLWLRVLGPIDTRDRLTKTCGRPFRSSRNQKHCGDAWLFLVFWAVKMPCRRCTGVTRRGNILDKRLYQHKTIISWSQTNWGSKMRKIPGMVLALGLLIHTRIYTQFP
jgi:hypothetical protein